MTKNGKSDEPGAPVSPVSKEAISIGYEPSDVSADGVFRFSVYLLLTLAGIVVLLSWGYRFYTHGYVVPKSHSSIWAGQPVPPVEVTALENESGREREAMQRANGKWLNSYGWIDRKKGVARIPIQRAMEIYLRMEERHD